MEIGSSEPSFPDEIGGSIEDVNSISNVLSDPGDEKSNFTQKINKIFEKIQQIVLHIQDNINALKELPNYNENLSEDEFDAHEFGDGEEEEEFSAPPAPAVKGKDIVISAIKEFTQTTSEVKDLLNEANDAINEIKKRIEEKQDGENDINAMDFESDTASEAYKDYSAANTRGSALKNKIKEAEESKIAAQHELQRLKEEINQLQYSMSSPHSEASSACEDDIDQRLHDYYDAEMQRFNKIYEFKTAEENEMKKVEQECIDTQNELQSEKIKLRQDLEQATERIAQMRATINSLVQQLEDFRFEKKYLVDHNKQLNAVVIDLEKIAEETNERRLRFEKAYQDHQSIVIAYQKAGEIIEQNWEKQDERISNLVESVQMVEKQCAEIQKYRSQCESSRNELIHIEEFIKKAKDKLNERVNEMEKSASKYYDSISEKINKRIEDAKLNNQHLIREKEFIENQVTMGNDKLQALKKASSKIDREDAVLQIFKVAEDVDNVYKNMRGVRDQILEYKKRIHSLSGEAAQDKRLSLQKINRQAQQLQIAISTSKIILKEMCDCNAHNEGINKQLQSYVNQKKSEMEALEEKLMSEKDAEIKAMSQNIDQTVLQNQREYINLENEAKLILEDTKFVKEEKENADIADQNKIEALSNELRSLTSVRKKLERRSISLLDIKNDIDKQVSDVVGEIAELQTKLRKMQSKYLGMNDTIITMQGNVLSNETELSLYKRQIKKLDKAIAKQESENKELSVSNSKE